MFDLSGSQLKSQYTQICQIWQKTKKIFYFLYSLHIIQILFMLLVIIYLLQYKRIQDMSDQQPTFDWDQARKEIEKSYTAITEAKINMIKLKTNIFQKMFDCDALRQRLIILLEKMEVQIKVAGKYLQFKANQFKNKLTQIIFSKYFQKIKKYYDVIFEICAVVFLLSATLLGLEYMAVISTLSTTAKTFLKRSLFLSGIGLTIYAVDTLYQVYQGFKNKQIFQQAIKQTQKALNQIQKLKKDLQ